MSINEKDTPLLIQFPYCDYKSGEIRTIAVNIAAIESIEFDVPIASKSGAATRVAVVRMRRNIVETASDGSQRSRNVHYIVAGAAASRLREIVRGIAADCEPKAAAVELAKPAPQPPQQPRPVVMNPAAAEQVDPLLRASFELIQRSSGAAPRDVEKSASKPPRLKI